jgi:hypothetical protein
MTVSSKLGSKRPPARLLKSKVADPLFRFSLTRRSIIVEERDVHLTVDLYLASQRHFMSPFMEKPRVIEDKVFD